MSQPGGCQGRCHHGRRVEVDQQRDWPLRRPVHWPVGQAVQVAEPALAEKVCSRGRRWEAGRG